MAKRRLVPLLLSLALLTGCGGGEGVTVRTGESAAPSTALQVGLICGGEEGEALLAARNRVTETLAEEGITVTWLVKTEVAEDESCTRANRDCAQAGCALVVNSALGMESLVTAAAMDYPQTHFVTCGGRNAWTDTLENTHTAYAATYQACYLAGLAAGEAYLADTGRTDPCWGWMTTVALAPQISDATAYCLGLRAACPQATMKVYFTGMSPDGTALEEARGELTLAGAERVTEAVDRTDCPGAIDWSVYLLHALRALAAGETLAQDWTGDLAGGSVHPPELSDSAPGAREVAEAARALTEGELEVFDTAKFTVKGERLTRALALDTDGDGVNDAGEAVYDGAYHECAYSSAPTFNYPIDGVEFLNLALF